MSSWNGLDFFIFLIFFLNIVLGISRGATKEITSLMCLSVALIFTIKFAVPTTIFLNKSPLINDVISTKIIQNFMATIGAGPLTADMLREFSYCLSILLWFVGVFSAGEAMLTMTGFNEVFKFPYATLNRKVGAGLGATRGYVLSVLLILILVHLFKNNPVSGYFVNLFQSSVTTLDSLILGQRVEDYNQVYKGRNLFNEQNVYKILSNPKQ